MTTLCAKAQKLHEQVLADLRLDELNISDRTKQCPSIKVNWLKTFIEEKKHLGVLERSVGIVTDQYVKEFGKEGVNFVLGAEHQIDISQELKDQSDVTINLVTGNDSAVQLKNRKAYRVLIRPPLSKYTEAQVKTAQEKAA